jgi:4a-hydroxytetrahydrobiopterin dehydratase
MTDLTELSCVACRRGTPTATSDEIAAYREFVPDWSLIEIQGVPRLRRAFTFPDFAGALAFTNAVGRLAEQEGHHPTTLTEWGRVTVTVWTFAINGLHLNDFILAAKIDRLVYTDDTPK